MIDVVNLRELCEMLRMGYPTGLKNWRAWPHFFPTSGRDAWVTALQIIGKNGRFDPATWLIFNHPVDDLHVQKS